MTEYLPANCALLLHVPDGPGLCHALETHPALREIAADPDLENLFQFDARRNQLLARYENLVPRRVRASKLLRGVAEWLIPPEPAALLPDLAREFAVVVFPPEKEGERAELSPPAKAPRRILILTRLAGARGQLARMAAALVKPPRNAVFFDLGGDLVAIGLNGAKPGNRAGQPPQAAALAQNSGAHPLFKLVVMPPALLEQRGQTLALKDLLQDTLGQIAEENVPEPVLRAILHPPGATEMLDVHGPPDFVQMEFFYSGRDDALHGVGTMKANLPPLPQSPQALPLDAGDYVLAEGALPINLRAIFLRYIGNAMRPPKKGSGLTRNQRRWVRRFENLSDDNVDLDRDLWPACGHFIHFSIEEPSGNSSATAYGLIKARLPFAGEKPAARAAAAELARERWDGALYETPPDKSEKPPYVRMFRSEDADRYVLATGQISTPAWAVSRNSLALTTDAGLFALLDGPVAQSFMSTGPNGSAFAAAPYYFLKLNGQRLAGTAEALAMIYYDDLEDELGSKEFMSQYPDREVSIRLAGKLSRLLGQFYAAAFPDAQNSSAQLEVSWSPGTLAAKAEKVEESIPPPPPAE